MRSLSLQSDNGENDCLMGQGEEKFDDSIFHGEAPVVSESARARRVYHIWVDFLRGIRFQGRL
jgi:hypothetical protein